MKAKLNKREEQLLTELSERVSTCVGCGAVSYPRTWMVKTREGLEKKGIIEECVGCSRNVWMMVKVDPRWRA